MANHKSAQKRARQDLRRRARNREVKSAMRSVVRRVRAAVQGGDAEAAATQLRAAERELRRAAGKGVIPKQRASRTVSRLSRAVHRLSS